MTYLYMVASKWQSLRSWLLRAYGPDSWAFIQTRSFGINQSHIPRGWANSSIINWSSERLIKFNYLDWSNRSPNYHHGWALSHRSLLSCWVLAESYWYWWWYRVTKDSMRVPPSSRSTIRVSIPTFWSWAVN